MDVTKVFRATLLAVGISAAGLPLPAHAVTIKTGSLTVGCSGGCVDVWEISCPWAATHSVFAKARDTQPPTDPVRVTAVGLTKPSSLLQAADIGINDAQQYLYTGSSRPLQEVGPAKILVMISSDAAPLAYELQAKCADAPGADIGDPIVTLLQDF
jgi:hypothetical protein